MGRSWCVGYYFLREGALTKGGKVLASGRVPFMCGKTDTMRSHVMKYCLHIASSPDQIAERDRIIVLSDAATANAKRARTVSNPQPPPTDSPVPSPNYPFPSMPPQSPRFENSSFASSSAHPTSPLSPLGGLSTLPSFSQDGSFSPSSSFAPSPSPSVYDSPSAKRRRTSYTTQSAPVWTADSQAEFGADLLKLFVTCGWSWNAVANPEFKLFFDKYVPSAVLPDRRVLSGRILTSEANKVIAATRQKIEGKLATYSEDGWKNVAHTHVDTSMLSVEGQVFILTLRYDCSPLISLSRTSSELTI